VDTATRPRLEFDSVSDEDRLPPRYRSNNIQLSANIVVEDMVGETESRLQDNEDSFAIPQHPCAGQ